MQTQINLTEAVPRLREVKDLLKPLKVEEKILGDAIKGSFEVGSHVVSGVPFKIVERETVSYDAEVVKAEFPRKLSELFEAGVFNVNKANFERWASDNGWDVSNIQQFSTTTVLNI